MELFRLVRYAAITCQKYFLLRLPYFAGLVFIERTTDDYWT